MNQLGRLTKRLPLTLSSFVKADLFLLFVGNFLIAFFAFGAQLVVSGLLKPEDIARIKLFQNYTQFASIFALFGLNTTVIKFCAEERFHVFKDQIFYSLVFFVSVIGFLVSGIFVFLNSSNLLVKDAVVKSFFSLYWPLIFPLALSQIYLAFYQAQGLFKKFASIQIFTKGIALILLVAGTYYSGVKGYMFFNFCGIYAGLGYLIYDCYKQFNSQVSIQDFISQLSLKSLKRVFYFSANSFVTSFNSQVNGLIGLVILGVFADDYKEVGFYSFAAILLLGYRLINTTVQQYLLPFFSKASSDKVELIRIYRRYSTQFAIFVGVVFLISQLLVPSLITLVFGGKYDGSIVYIKLGLIFWLFYSLTAVKSAFLIASGNVKFNARLSSYVMAISVVSNLLLIYYFSVLGAAVADIFNNVVSYCLHVRYSKKVLNYEC